MAMKEVKNMKDFTLKMDDDEFSGDEPEPEPEPDDDTDKDGDWGE